MNELYKIILVDDEDDVRGRVISKITEADIQPLKEPDPFSVKTI